MPKRLVTRLVVMVHGEVHPRWLPVRRAFADVIADGEAGAALSIVHDGETVLDLWGGSDPTDGTPWRQDSATLGFSAAKGIVALLAAMEIEAGRLDPSARVADYWPEFAAAGKGEITVGDVMTHVAGIPVLPLDSVDDLLDPLPLAARLAASPPSYPPRSARIYHILSYGVVLAEVLRRITGRDIGALLQARIADPLGASLWLGMPEAADPRFRRALMDPVESPPEPGPIDGAVGAAIRASYLSTAQIIPLFERVDGVIGTEPMNGPGFRRAQVPGGGLVTDARSLARAYGACTATVDGVRLISDDTARLVSADHLGGIPEPTYLPGTVPTTRWGLGFEISHRHCRMLGEGSFGHAGMGGRLAFAHLPSRLGFAFVGQRMLFPEPGADPRWSRLLGAVESVLVG